MDRSASPFTLHPDDLELLRAIGKSESDLCREIRLLASQPRHVRLKRPCAPGDGMLRLAQSEQDGLVRRYRPHAGAGRALKFVAASGAASRMFRQHESLLHGGADVDRDGLLAQAARGNGEARLLLEFFDRLREFAFFGELSAALAAAGQSAEAMLERGSYRALLEFLLSKEGLGYGGAAKGLIPFHRYRDGVRTAFEEHLVEAVPYLRDGRGIVRVHFTIPADDQERVRAHLSQAARRFSDESTRYEVSISAQQRSTDTVPLDHHDHVVRDKSGRMLLRASGHGALLGNLAALKGDIVFIRTIDNVLPDRLKRAVCYFKEVLGGLLVEVQERVFEALSALSSGPAGDEILADIRQMVESDLSIRLPRSYAEATPAAKTETLCRVLNRPLRVCAMVPHEGEPGGGPFWVEDPEGSESLQIVEAAQVDMDSPEQRDIWQSSGYFNPADIVCGLRDFRGEPFNLAGYRDPEAWFVSTKSYGDRQVRVLELPGLWNGGMAFWNTVFLEVPKATLHPVKSVMDLLDPRHRTGEN